ncbi:MAG: methylated-DNA--[protein]-cysteine S-methyltransferase [Spirochaetota bacterium]|jgi:O-6-methylguanine DNA methyltransferase|nr:methylated-DNA--[protein]-cysteine S-methyltransferase [Spirochaetota bacterium]
MAQAVLSADGRIERIILDEGLVQLLDALMPLAADSPDFSQLVRSAFCAPPDPALSALLAFFSGADLREYYARCSYNGCTPWQLGVMQAMASIERGKVLSYGGLAARLSASRAARAVGNSCARNPLPLLYPCHRVVQSDGRIGAFMSRKGGTLKRRLLEFEGVHFDSNGRVCAECFAG